MRKIYLNILCAILLTSVVSCKKYGYKFNDGYNPSSAGNVSNVTVDTSMSRVDRSLYARARIFPGLIDPAEPRVVNDKFTLDLNFSASDATLLRIAVAPKPQFSTGYWAPAGELIKIVVPDGVNGLSVQVGGQTDDLTGQLNLQRDPLIYTVKALFPGVNYVRNGYGGTIYISAAVAIPQPVQFTITGAAKSPDFVLGTSDNATWIAQVKASTVPWLELRSKRVIFLIPRSFLISNFNSATPLTDPTALMTAWNNVFELDYNGWMGLSDNSADIRDRSPQSAWREVLDIQPSLGYGHNGFPTVATEDIYWFNSVVTIDNILHGANWGTYHEFGHNCQQSTIWSWSTLGETTNNLFSFKVAHRSGADFAIQHPPNDWMQAALDFAATNNDATNFNTIEAMNDPFRRMVPFMQILEIYGYDAMPYLYTAARHAQRLSNTDQDKQDFVYERFSEFAKTDLKPFFDAWGISVSSLSNSIIKAKYPLLTKQIWTYNPITKKGGTAAIVFKTTVTASSEETVAEGSVDGFATAMIDGDNNTYWHSEYYNQSDNYPYTLVLNAGGPVTAKGMYFVPRNSTAQRPKNADIYTSTDNVNFTFVGSTIIANAFARYEYMFPASKTAQYYKVILKDSWTGSPNAALAEMNLIK